jgi:hypothetical protein
MAEQTVYCEECVEEIPASEVYWDEGRLYCGRCGSELEPPDRDIFEEIVDNRTGFLFRDEEPAEEDDEEEEKDEAEPEADAAAGDEDNGAGGHAGEHPDDEVEAD